jgi:site-specific DNA recombinase
LEKGSTMTRAAIYCRISLDRDGRGLGVDRQREDCLAIARDNGWNVPEVSIYIDNDVSASEFSQKARANYLRLLSDIEAGKYDAVILWMEDRGHRQVIEAGEFVKLCQKHGVGKLVIASEEKSYNLTDPVEVANFYGRVVEAQKETAKASRRQRRKRQQMAEQGLANGGGRRPFGFTGAGTHKVPLARALVEQDLIREAASRVLAGDSLRGICTDWNARGVETTTGAKWTTRAVRQMILSPRVAGLREHHGELYPATWSAIVDHDTWQGVRTILTNPARRTNHSGGNAQYLLTGLLFCGVCGNRMRARKQSGRDYLAYVCQRAAGSSAAGGNCVQRQVKPVDDYVSRVLFQAVEQAPGWNQMAVTEQRASDPSAKLYEALAADRARLDGLEDKLADDLLSPEAYKRQRARIEDRMEQARRKLAALQGNRVTEHIPANLRELWPEFSLDRRRAILGAIFERVEVHRTGRGFGNTFDPRAIKLVPRTG